jgi:hypothetical protein
LNSNNCVLLLAISGHVAFLRDFVDLVAVPDRPNPSEDESCGQSLAEADAVRTVVATLGVIVGLEYSALSWCNDVEEKNPVGTAWNYGVNMVVTAHNNQL